MTPIVLKKLINTSTERKPFTQKYPWASLFSSVLSWI